MSKFKLPKKFTKNPNATEIPQDYLEREKNILYQGEYNGLKYYITENDFIRKEITWSADDIGRLDLRTMQAVLHKWYGKDCVSAGIPSWAPEYFKEQVS